MLSYLYKTLTAARLEESDSSSAVACNSVVGSNSVATTKTRYGWKRDLPDFRDKYKYFFYPDYYVSLATPSSGIELERDDGSLMTIPAKAIDLRPNCPPVYDQGDLGSCTANAVAAAYQYDQMMNATLTPDVETFCPSRLFIYYNERLITRTPDSDSGGSLRNAVKTIGQSGLVPEPEWPYDISKFKTKPSVQCYEDAKHHRAVQYRKIMQQSEQLKECLRQGYPFVFGFAVYESFEADEVKRTGIVPMPEQTERMIGGHAVLAVGFDDSRQVFIIRNSWGENWGDKGYFYMPYDYILSVDLASDFWVVTKISDV